MRFALLVVALVACGKSEPAKSEPAKSEGPVVVTPLALFDDNAPSGRVTVTSSLAGLGDGKDYDVHLRGDPGGERMLSLFVKFKDRAAALAKSPKKNDLVTVTCTVGKAGGSLRHLDDCDLVALKPPE
jgi:hypothetical protein